MDWKGENETLLRYARQVREAGFNDCHSIDGHFIELGGEVDGAEPPCVGCGLRLPATAPLSAHRRDCPNYKPHPDSIVVWLADYEDTHDKFGDNHAPGQQDTITYNRTHGIV